MKKNNEELNSKKNIFEKEKDQLIKNNNKLNIIKSALNTENENLKNGNQKLEEDTAKLKSKKKHKNTRLIIIFPKVIDLNNIST